MPWAEMGGGGGSAHPPQKAARLGRARPSTAEAPGQEAAERHDITDSRSSGQQKNG